MKLTCTAIDIIKYDFSMAIVEYERLWSKRDEEIRKEQSCRPKLTTTKQPKDYEAHKTRTYFTESYHYLRKK